MLIARYYDFDQNVVREFLGKKLSSRNRKDLDEVSEKTGVDIKSCRRQFDNIKRVYKAVEELPGPLSKNIQTHFLLPEELARKYAAIVYITHNRFRNWQKEAGNPNCKYEESGMEMDREFLQHLREMNHISKHTLQDVESNFKSLTRTLVNIAYGLNHSKDLRDFFIDIVEKIIEPCRAAHWTVDELQLVMDAFVKSPQSVTFAHDIHLHEVWVRYAETMAKCVYKLYSA
ncbi:hypothetical protein MRX96_033631 [Rhipicephalus microplus]